MRNITKRTKKNHFFGCCYVRIRIKQPVVVEIRFHFELPWYKPPCFSDSHLNLSSSLSRSFLWNQPYFVVPSNHQYCKWPCTFQEERLPFNRFTSCSRLRSSFSAEASFKYCFLSSFSTWAAFSVSSSDFCLCLRVSL